MEAIEALQVLDQVFDSPGRGVPGGANALRRNDLRTLHRRDHVHISLDDMMRKGARGDMIGGLLATAYTVPQLQNDARCNGSAARSLVLLELCIVSISGIQDRNANAYYAPLSAETHTRLGFKRRILVLIASGISENTLAALST